MVILKKKLKKILGFVSIGVLLIGTALGILTRENSPKVSPNQSLNRDYQPEDSYASNLQTEIEQPKLICGNLLEKDENTFVFEEYSKVKVVECQFVGCAGVF